MDVDENLKPIEGSEQLIECDTLILSVGLIPENEISEKLNIELSPKTKGAYVDNNLQTLTDGVFAAGNCLSVNDLVDYVSENGFIAGKAAAIYSKRKEKRNLIKVKSSQGVLTCIPQYIDLNSDRSNITFYLRSDANYVNKEVIVKCDDNILFKKSYKRVNQAESIKFNLDLNNINKDIEVDII